MRINQATDVLLAVDVQKTFMPGGGLAVAEGDGVVAPINALLTGTFLHAVATQDWHPRDHLSFAANHPGKQPYDTIAMPYGEQTLWPVHAVTGTEEAALHPGLRQERFELVIRKGFHAAIDSYSTFFENDRATPTGLDGYLRARGFGRLFIAGIATDFCVAWSAEDGLRLGYEVFVIADACRGIGIPTRAGRTTIDDARDRLAAGGARFITSFDLQA